MILLKDFFLANISILFFTFSSVDIRFAERGAHLRDLNDCKSLAYDQAVATLQCKKMCDGGPRDNDKSFCDWVSEAKNILIIISAEYLDYTNVFF